MKALSPSLALLARLLWAGVALDEANYIVGRQYPLADRPVVYDQEAEQ